MSLSDHLSLPENPPSQEEIIAHLLAAPDAPARQDFLRDLGEGLGLTLIEALKARSDSWLLRDAHEALRIATIAIEAADLLAELASLNPADTDLAVATAAWAGGNARLYLCEYHACLEAYQFARSRISPHGRTLETARLRVNEIAALRYLGEYSAAIQAAEDARALLVALPTSPYMATLEMNLGSTYYNLGNFPGALDAFQRGGQIFRDLGNSIQAARIDVNSALSLEYLDRLEEAEKLLRTARVVLEENELTQEVARVDLNLGELFYRQARYQAALKSLEHAHAGFSALKNRVEIAVVDLYRARVYLALNLLPETLELSRNCAAEFAQQDMKRQEGLAILTSGMALRDGGKLRAALRSFNRARRTFHSRQALVEVALIDLERATLHYLTGKFSSAMQIASRTEKALEGNGLQVRAAQAGLLQAWCALDLGEVATAQTLAQKVLDTSIRFGLATLTYRVQHILGRIAEAQGQISVAFEAYRQAIEAVESLSRDLWMDEFRAAFLTDKLALYEDAVRMALDLGQTAKAFELAGRATDLTVAGISPGDLESAPEAAGQALLEELSALRRAWQWKYSTLEKPRDGAAENDLDRSTATEAAWGNLPALETRIAETRRRLEMLHQPYLPYSQTDYSLESILQTLPTNTIFLQYYMLKDQLMAFIVRPDGVDVIRNIGSAQDIKRQVERWRFLLDCLRLYPPGSVDLNHAGFCSDAQTHLRRLYDLLVRPLSLFEDIQKFGGDEQDVPLVYIRSHPVLNGLPFAALYDGSRYLVEKCQTVFFMGSGAVDEYCPDLSTPLVVGYSDQGRLPYAIEEARGVAAIFEKSPDFETSWLLIEENATESGFAQRCQKASLIHLATHAAYRADNPFFSWLLLHKARLTVADLYHLQLGSHPLVTLSACETGLGEWHGGGLIGLCRALMAAGAGAILASLWKVFDDSTADWMASYYQQLSMDRSAGQALRAAQLDVMKRMPHPIHWSGFVLVQKMNPNS